MSRGRWSMPPSVIYVVGVVRLLVLMNVVTMNVCPIILGGLVVAGMVTGHRLAWQWGRILMPLAAVLMLLVGLAGLSVSDHKGDPTVRAVTGAVFVISATVFLSIFFALGR